ncbi:phosphotransferase [Legionella spiritensis]|uniref:phosphotransferase n=1 Tax=Legionella spiritensis TaxID=452 RepID=UPI000F71D289|nr:phosphotransferase [Legionella spiritensis]VEG92268.1 Domain of uncharacterised function (DUF227) [Legionella spiritensis]
MRGKDREIDPVIRKKTLDIIQKKFEFADIDIDSFVYLSEPERRNVLLRITLTSTSESVPKSIILKQSLPQQEDINDTNADARFFRDWAGIKFASNIQQNEHVHNTPLFYGSDNELRFILIEYLGDPHISLVDSLAPAVPNRSKAVSALERYMKALGCFHAASFGHTDSYETILKEINENATVPEEDLKSISENLQPKLQSAVETLGLPVATGFTDEVQQVLESIFKPGPFTVLTHGDIAPDNVFDHEEPEDLQLIDFEWSSPRNALLDGTYLRMSMPTAWFAKTIPDDVLKPLELIYREELKKAIPEASDDLAYSTNYTQACAYHVLHEMSNLTHILEKDAVWGSGPVPKDSLWNPDTNSARSRFLTRLQTFVDVVTNHDKLHPDQPPILPHLRKMAEDMLGKVKGLWPEAKSLESYPAFKPVSLNSKQVLHPTLSSSEKPESIHNREVVTPTTVGYKKENADVPIGTSQEYKEVLSLMRQDDESVPTADKENEAYNNYSINLPQITPKLPWEI